MQIPETVEIGPPGPVDGSVIWLHGLGADGHDFEPIVPELGLDGVLDLRFVFPHAPVRPVTINGGYAMRAWYDILTLDRGGPQDEAGIRDSIAILGALIEREKERGVPSERITVAGFSQGGAIASATALSAPEPLAGLVALSTYLPLADWFRQEVFGTDRAQRLDLPIFMAHGTFDPMLPASLGEDSRDFIAAAGYEVEWHDYPMAHSVCAEEIEHIGAWLKRVYADA